MDGIFGPVTQLDKTQLYNLGTHRDEITSKGPKRYVYVKFVNAVDVTAGMLLYPAAGATPYSVSPDLTGGTYESIAYAGTGNTIYPVAGIAPVDVDVSVYPYGWIQVAKGYCENILTDGNAAAGSRLVAGDTNGTAVQATIFDYADGNPIGDEYAIFAHCDAADTSTVGTGWLVNTVF